MKIGKLIHKMPPKVRVPKKAVQEVTLEPENIKLVKVLIQAKIFDITELPCSITCDEENGKVEVAGDDDFITDIATSIRQVAYEMAHCKISENDGFLCTAKGEQWIAEEFKEHGIAAIIYTKDQVTYILAKDEKHLGSATANFKKIARSQKVELDQPILSYLRSLEWNETVKDFQAKCMVQVISDFENARIFVRGRREDVISVIAYIKLVIHNKKSESSQHLPLTCLYQRSADYKASQPVQPQVIVVKGDIATFTQADVLVSTIAVNTNGLKVAGSVSESFLKAGGEALQKEFEKAGAPINFGTDVTVTGTAGTIQAKKIFVAAIGHMHNAMSLELLTSLLKTCLRRAEEMKLRSIAFPTLGCGYLRYNQADVSRCFAEAAKGSRLQIYIVAYTQDLYEKFRDDFMAQEPADFKKSTSSETVVPVVQKLPPAVAPKTEVPVPSAPVFAKHVLKSLPTAIKLLIQTPRTATTVIVEMSIVHPAIAQLNDEVAAKIQSLQSPHVQVAIDKSISTITVTGAKEALVVMKQIVFKALTGDDVLQSDLSYIKKHKGVKAYLIALGRGWNCMKACNPMREIPEYWTISSRQDAEDGLHVMKSSAPKRLLLAKSTPVYDAVELMVRRDALSGINVTNIWIVANKVLFRDYQSKLKTFALKAADSSFRTITDLGEPDIITKTVTGTDVISEHLVSEVNEAYLCHGTTHVNEIEKTGIDSRFCGDFGYFGRGAYFAENSTKSDQYAKMGLNPRAKRYIFVARVLLGEPFQCKKSDEDLRRAPCQQGCKGSCTAADHRMCDSVFGIPKDLREFVVYNPEQSYPEFLVEYTSDNN